MALVKLAPLPGVVKPGTLYGALGRWYHTFMARWHEGVMQAIKGWQPESLAGGATMFGSETMKDDGGVLSGTTWMSDLPDAHTPISMFVASAVDDAFYIGSESSFLGVTLRLVAPTHAAGHWVLAYEYWDGNSWEDLAPLDLSDELTVQGWSAITWVDPGDWAETTVGGVERFWIRIRVTTVVTPVTLGVNRLRIGAYVALGEVVRGTHSWSTAGGAVRLALGTPTSVYVLSAGVLEDVTPSGFTAGAEDASTTAGAFGAGAFGVGPFGLGDDSVETIVEAQTWQFDNYGEDLLAVAYSDGKLYTYDTSSPGDMTAVTNAPTGNEGVVVTEEGYVLLLGAGDNGRLIKWPDIDDITDWTPGASDTAGDIALPSRGQILAGERTQGETLVWTDADVWSIRYIGGEFIYKPSQVGTDGALSRRAMVVDDREAFWMGRRGFYVYDGYTRPLPSDVSDYVFGDLNVQQASKIWTETRAEFGEITWHYPSATSLECNRSVTYNRRGRFWLVNEIARTAGEDRGPWAYPMAYGADGLLYRHEVGDSYLVDGAEVTPYAEQGPVEIGSGDEVMEITGIIPDEESRGDLSLTLFTSYYPTATEVENGPYTPANPTSVRLNGRWARLKVTQVSPDWRLGTVRLDVQLDGER